MVLPCTKHSKLPMKRTNTDLLSEDTRLQPLATPWANIIQRNSRPKTRIMTQILAHRVVQTIKLDGGLMIVRRHV